MKSKWVKESIDNSFKNVEQYMKNFHMFLEKVYDNESINFAIIINEKLKDPQTFIHLLMKRFTHQMTEFDDFLPDTKDLGMLRIDFSNIKKALKPNPWECFEKLRKMIPPEIKRWVEECWKWIQRQTHELTKKVGDDPEEFVK